jgi:hypothetical protein
MTFVFSTTGSLLSRIIRAMSDGDVSHCGIALTLDNVHVVADSALLGCEMVTRDRWLRGKKLVYEFEVPEAHQPPLSAVLGPLGAGYDYSGMLGYLPIWVARWCGRKLRNPSASPTKAVCSEYLVRVMQHGASGEWAALDPESLYPEDLVSLCRALGYRRVLAAS